LCLEEGSSPFLETITHPVPAAGALAWVKSAMGNPEHYKQVHAAANTAAYLHVVSEICKAHVRLRLEALETVTAAIAAMGKGANEQTHLATLDVAVELVEHGLVLPALRAATDKWRRDVDPSHLRYFAGEVLEVAGPPYSGAFAAAALELLRAANAGKGMTRACDEFVEQCRRQRARGALQPPLSKDLDEVLDRLAGSGAKGR
jgi:negative elongation factor C/D